MRTETFYIFWRLFTHNESHISSQINQLYMTLTIPYSFLFAIVHLTSNNNQQQNSSSSSNTYSYYSTSRQTWSWNSERQTIFITRYWQILHPEMMISPLQTYASVSLIFVKMKSAINVYFKTDFKAVKISAVFDDQRSYWSLINCGQTRQPLTQILSKKNFAIN